MGDPSAGRMWVERSERFRRAALRSLVAANVIFPVLLVLTRRDDPWRAFAGEASPITWFSTIQCALIGLTALGVYFVSHPGPPGDGGGAGGARTGPKAWPWLAVGLGCFVLSIDEQFQVHERSRDRIFVPNGILTEVPGLRAGDFLLLLYVGAGAAVVALLQRDLRSAPPSLPLFSGAILLAGAVALLDASTLGGGDDSGESSARIVVEELGEVWAQALLACAAITVLFARVRSALVAHGAERSEHATRGAPGLRERVARGG